MGLRARWAIIGLLGLFVWSSCSTFGAHKRLPQKTAAKARADSTEERKTLERSPAGLPNDIAKAAYHLGIGYLYWLNEDIEQALSEFKIACSFDPQSAFLNYNLGEKYYLLAMPSFEGDNQLDGQLRRQVFERAEYYFDNAFAIDPNDLEIVTLLADTKRALGKSSEVIFLSRAILELDRNNIAARIQLAEELVTIEDYREAIDVLKPVLQAMPDHAQANYLTGYNLMKLRRQSEARPFLEKAYDQSPYHPLLVEMLGRIYEDLELYDQALPIYRKIALISPKDSPFYEMYVRVLLLLEQYDNAEKVMKEILEDGVERGIYYYFLGMIAEYRGTLGTAIDYYKMAHSLNKNDFRFLYKLSVLLYHVGEHDKSIAVLEEALTQSPDNPWLYLFLGEAYTRQGKYELALDVFNRGVALAPDDTEFYMQKAVLYEKMGSFSEAEAMLLKVLSLDNKYADALNFLGFMYAERGENLDTAEQYLLEALGQQPNNGAFLDSLGWIYFKQNKYMVALALLEKASVMLENRDAVVLDHLADAFAVIGCYETAVTIWRRVIELDDQNEKALAKIKENTGKDNFPESECPPFDFTSTSSPGPVEDRVSP